MKITITSGDATVVDSGSVFSYNDKPILIQLLDLDSAGQKFYLKFSFSYDPKNSEPRQIPVIDTSNNGVNIELINYNNPLGTGLLSPVIFARSKSGPFYCITFMVSSWEQTKSKLFSYTIYRFEKTEGEKEEEEK